MHSDDMEADDASQGRLAPHGGKVPWASSTAEDTVSGYSEVGSGRYESPLWNSAWFFLVSGSLFFLFLLG